MANGLPADTPAVAIERGTTAQQRVVRTCTKYAIMFGFFSFFVFPFFLNWIQR
jgi:hypothetical protein